MASFRHRRGPFDHKSLQICQSFSGGVGLQPSFVLRPKIELAPFAGPVWPAVSDLDLPVELRGRPIQINEWYVQAAGGWADLFAHSCDPNAGLRWVNGKFWIVTRRLIKKGEEITWDYAMSQWSDEFFFYPPGPCQCGSGLCRGEKLGAESLPLDVARMYLGEGWGTPFIWEKLLRRLRGEL